MERPRAEKCHYWKTSQSAPGIWLDRAAKLIHGLGGTIRLQGYGANKGTDAYIMAFELDGEPYKIVWPVLNSASKNHKAARIQAATMLHHDIKAKCVSAAVLGNRTSFFSFLMLPDGRTTAEAANTELPQLLPSIQLSSIASAPSNIVDGEFSE
jgi:hypothetical protein